MRIIALLLAFLLPAAYACAGQPTGREDFMRIPGAAFKSVLRYPDAKNGVRVAPFDVMTEPVTNAQFLAFVRSHPQWRRDRVARVFAETRYLSHWQAADKLGANALPDQPVTRVSWFAADAYCKSQGARLPTWSEWEVVAAADETRRDARSDPRWRERILAWYTRPSGKALARIGQSPANVYGVRDVHGLVWEWTDDFSSLLVSGDNRNQGDADKTKFCGAGALSMDDRENYAVLMRIAMLSSLEGSDTTANLGFRCARSSR